jgi:diguanylate cyclase (GGDEF)-like protein
LPVDGVSQQQVTRRAVYLAAGVAVLVVTATGLMLPFSARPFPILTPFLTIFATTVCLVESLTAYFLAFQFRSSRDPFLAGLSGAYGFTAVIVFFQILVFPGQFSLTGLLGAGPQSAIWIWVFWHGGFPVFVTFALLLRSHRLTRGQEHLLPRIGAALMAAGPLTAAGLAYLAIAGKHFLPPIITGQYYGVLTHSLIAPALEALAIMAIGVCLWTTRLRDLLTLWIAVALVTGLADIVLAMTAASRYSLGWYGGRVLSVISSSIVLCVLIFEFSKLYDQLIKINRGLSERAIRDGLTGAFNRGYFIEQFPREMRRAARDRATLSLLMIDVDHFKAYNDLRGHQMGDQCLIAVVGALRATVRRPADFIARYGGEEFAVVLPGTNAAGAARLAQAIREAVRGRALSADDKTGALVTVSAGIATFDARYDAFTGEELVRRADVALYQAKAGGRDTYRVYGGDEMASFHDAPPLPARQAG